MFMFSLLSLLLLAAAPSGALAEGEACSVGGRQGRCLDSTSCGTNAGMRAYAPGEPGVDAANCVAAEAGDDVACCAAAIYGACQTTWGKTGSCRHVDACDSPFVGRPASEEVSGCDASLESSGVLCCVEPPAEGAATTAPGAEPGQTGSVGPVPGPGQSGVGAAPLPNGPRCTAYGVEGRCLSKTACPRGTSPLAYRRNFVTGCENYGSSIQCCSSGRPPALPAGRSCVAYGRIGSCLLTSQCNAPYTSHPYRRGFSEGCENENSNVQCCSTGIPPLASAPPVAGNVNSAGTISVCQAIAVLQRGGVPQSVLGKLTCTAKYESTFNCRAQNLGNSDGTGDYGLMQANSRWWCSGGRGRNSGNGCRTSCASLVGDCEAAGRCAATIVRTHNGGLPRSLLAWVAYSSHKTECDNFRLPPSCGVSFLKDDEGNDIEVFTGEGTGEEGAANGTTADTDNSLAIGLGVGIPVAIICILAIIAAVVVSRRRSFDVEAAMTTPSSEISMQSARSARTTGDYACTHCGKSYPTPADLAHHVTLRHP